MQPTLLILCLALVPAILADLEVPLGCVEIRNRDIDRFLVSSTPHDNDRRHVGYNAKAEQWYIEKDGNDYRIIHYKLGEELIESAQTWNGNYVFTWKARDRTNVRFGHCLWTKGVGGWIGAYPECYGWEFQWQIHKFDCKN
ncbi:hypothetical protein quinque_006985 [Culex quinquefasciatus]